MSAQPQTCGKTQFAREVGARGERPRANQYAKPMLELAVQRSRLARPRQTNQDVGIQFARRHLRKSRIVRTLTDRVSDVKELGADALADRVRLAFAGGVSVTSAATLLEARDGGLGWEEATRAVADGLARHYGAPVPERLLPPESAALLQRYRGDRQA